MANLKSAAVEIENAKKVNRSSWEDSTYRQKIESTLQEVFPGLQGDLLTASAKFFKPEWEVRSQKFLKRFMMWSKKATSEVEIIHYAKFGTGQAINVAAMANNLDIGFPPALFQVMQLAGLGLCRRVEPTVSTRGDPVFNVVFLPAGYVRFFLLAREEGEEFSDADLHELATGLFEHEVKSNQPFAAANFIVEAVNAKHHFEDRFGSAGEAAKEIGALCRRIMSEFQAAPNMAFSAATLADLTQNNLGLIDFCLLALALHDPKQFVRVEPFVLKKAGSSRGDVSRLALSYRPTVAPSSGPTVTNIGSLSMPHAKEVLKAAAAQSPVHTDPVMPPGTVRLDAALLGAATTEQLQASMKSLRDEIEKVAATARDAVVRANNVGNAVDKINDNPTIGLQVQIDVLRDQVAVLMKLAGVGDRPQPILTVHTAPPTASPLKAYLKSAPRKKPSTAKKKANKAATKKTTKKSKKRR